MRRLGGFLAAGIAAFFACGTAGAGVITGGTVTAPAGDSGSWHVVNDTLFLTVDIETLTFGPKHSPVVFDLTVSPSGGAFDYAVLFTNQGFAAQGHVVEIGGTGRLDTGFGPASRGETITHRDVPVYDPKAGRTSAELVIKVTALPEPSSVAMAVCGAGALVFANWRRRVRRRG